MHPKSPKVQNGGGDLLRTAQATVVFFLMQLFVKYGNYFWQERKRRRGGDLLKKIQATVEWFLGLTGGLANGSALAHTRQTLVLARVGA